MNCKILHLITGLPTGGAQTSLYNLLVNNDRQRCQHVVVSLMDKGVMGEKIQELGVDVHAVGMGRGLPTPATVNRLIQVMKSIEDPQIIQGWMYHGNLAAWVAGSFAHSHIPVLWNVRHTPYNMEDEKRTTAALIHLEARLSALTKRIIYNSTTSRERHQALGFDEDRGVVIPNGFDLETFKPSKDHYASVRRELGVSPDAKLIGLLARYHPMKDHTGFFQAAAILAQDFPEIHFVLAGEGVDANNQTLVNVIENLGLKSRSHLLGERDDTPRLTAALDIATNCSAWGEAFSNAIGEAMACRVPCVVTDVGDSTWLVDRSGFVVPPRDPQALAEGWKTLLSMDPGERLRMGELARTRIQDHFSMSAMVDAYQDLYSLIVESPARS